MNEKEEIREGYIKDYISGIEIKATPEELDAVQVFSKQLVDDYGYPVNYIQTRPQYRVKSRPSDNKKEYPVDIAVFTSSDKVEENAYIIVECKKKNRKDGKSQLEDYLRFSRAYLGVWFNGEERLFLQKVEKEGKVDFIEIPNIPKFGQRVEDIGKFKRKDLKPTHNLKSTFKAIRNHLAANTIGATRDEILAQQLINLIFCKIYDEKFTKPEDFVTFRAGINEDIKVIRERIEDLFTKVKTKYKDVMDGSEVISLDDKSIHYVVGELQNYSLIDAERDIIADAFETFIGHALKGAQGQFFTPRNVVKMIIDILDPNEDDILLDPACGSGGFLIEGLRHIWNKLDKKAIEYNWGDLDLIEEKQAVALQNIRGIDKDSFLSKVTKAYMAILGDGKGGIFCEDSLENPDNWNSKTKQKISLNYFDIIVTNPPFGSKIPVKGEAKLKQYDLAYKWKKDKTKNIWNKTDKLNNEGKKGGIEPQILFIERCVNLLKENGRMGIVLPDGIFGNDTLGYIREYLLQHGRVLAIIDIPIETFMPNTSTKTSILIYQKTKKKDNFPVFMAIAEECGHDRRGKFIEEDDIPLIANEYHKWEKQNNVTYK